MKAFGNPSSLADSATPAVVDLEAGSRAQRKAALRLLPVISIGYGLACMDRINISFASLHMNSDLPFQRH